MTDRIPARTPDGEPHDIVYEGARHLIPDEAVVIDLPPAGEGHEWVLVHRRVGEG